MNDFNEKSKDLIALEECIATPENREALLFEIKRHAKTKLDLDNRSKTLSEDIKSSAEVFGIKSSKLSNMIKDYLSGNLDEIIQLRNAEVDILEVIKDMK